MSVTILLIVSEVPGNGLRMAPCYLSYIAQIVEKLQTALKQ